jgi:hypothetical protein
VLGTTSLAQVCIIWGPWPFPNCNWLYGTAFSSILKNKHSSSEVRVKIRIITAFIALKFWLSFLYGIYFYYYWISRLLVIFGVLEDFNQGVFLWFRRLTHDERLL